MCLGFCNFSFFLTIKNGDCKKVLSGHTKQVNCLFIFGKYLYSGSSDRTIKEWDIETGICKRTFNKNENWVTCIHVTKNFLFASGYEQNILIYDLKSGNKLNTLKGHQKKIVSLIVTENDILYSASSDGVLRSWDIDSGECMKMYHYKDSIASIEIYKNYLLTTLYSEVTVLDIETDQVLPSFVGISSFTIEDDTMCGWNRIKSCFEFIDIKVRNIHLL